MSDKKFYWLKLQHDFFKDKKIKKLRNIAGGDTFTIIYLKMQLLSLKNEGKLIFEGVEDEFAEELALDLDEEVDNVKVTLAFLLSKGLIEEVCEDEYILPQTIENIGKEGSSAARVRKHRAKKKNSLPKPDNPEELPAQNDETLQCNAPVTKCNTETEQEKETEQERDKEKETDEQTNPSETEEFNKQDRDHIDLVKDLFASWSVSDSKLLFLYSLARDQIPYEPGITPYEYDIRVYEGLQRLTMKARAEDVKYIYAWMQKLIPLSEF
ncbi:MAG: phage replisome organizer N-terminal domain-containing protein [Lachnospiraceae bacterium]